MDYLNEYRSKLKTPEEAVRAVKDGDWVDYTSNLGFPPLLDAALAARRDELHDVKIRGNLIFGPIKVAECDPSQEHFCYNSWHFSGYERKLADRGLCYFIPMVFRNPLLQAFPGRQRRHDGGAAHGRTGELFPFLRDGRGPRHP